MPADFDFAAAAQRAVRELGGPVQAARKLGLERYQTAQSWTRNRVPAEYCPAIERETQRRVRCEEMRPDIPWDVLRQQAANGEPWDGVTERRAANQTGA